MSRYEPINVTVKRHTDKAVLVELTDQDDREVWIPISQIHEEDQDDLSVGEQREINITTWFYEQEIET